jgi:hypothetical protein
MSMGRIPGKGREYGGEASEADPESAMLLRLETLPEASHDGRA